MTKTIINNFLTNKVKLIALIMFVISIFLTSTFGFLYGLNDINNKEIQSALASINYTCSQGQTNPNNIAQCVIGKITNNYTRCPDGTIPTLAGGFCNGQTQNYVWACDSRAGETQIYSTFEGALCASTADIANFYTGTCRWNEGNLPGGLIHNGSPFSGTVFDGQNPDNRSARFREMVRYNYGTAGYHRSDYACQSASSNTPNGCPDSSFRIILGGAPNNYGTSYPTVNVLCAKKDRIGATGTNFSTEQGDPLLPTATGNSSSSGYNQSWNCGASNTPGYLNIIGDRSSSGHDERLRLCGLSSFAPQRTFTEIICPDASWAQNPNDPNSCVRAATVVNYTVDQFAIGNGTCAPNPIDGNLALFTCSFPLSGSPNNLYVLPANGIYAGYWKSNITNDGPNTVLSQPCTIINTTLQCTSITADNVSGTDINFPVFVYEPNVYLLQNKATITINSATCDNGTTNFPACNVCPLNQILYNGLCQPVVLDNDITTYTVLCNNGNPVYINSLTTCVININNNKVISPVFKMSIGNGDASTSSCAMNPSNATQAICTTVSTGSVTGFRPMFGIATNGGNPVLFQNTTLVIKYFEVTDLIDMDCTPDTQFVNLTINCRSEIPENVDASNLSVKVSAIGAYGACISTGNGSGNFYLWCDGIDVGSVTGTQIAYIKSDNPGNTFGDTQIDTVIVNRNALISDYVLTCTPDISLINQTIDCSGTLPANIIDDNIKVKVNSNGTSEVDCTNVNQIITCSNINVEDQLGQRPVLIKSDNILEYVEFETVLVNRNATNSDITINCTPDTLIIPQTYNCTGTTPQNVLINSLNVRTDTAGIVTSCVITNQTSFTCTNINAGTALGLRDVLINTNGSQYIKVEEITVNKNASQSDFNINCNPEFVIAGQNITCAGTVSNENIVLTDLKVYLEATGTPVSCTITGLNINCPSITTSLPIGPKDIFYTSDQIPTQVLFDSVTVLRNAVTGDISLDCDPSTRLINETVNCIGSVSQYIVLNNPIIKVGTNGTSTNCSVSNTGAISCNNVNVGTTLGIQNIILNANQFSDLVVDNVLVRTTADAGDINITCNPDVTFIDNTVDCAGRIAPNKVATNLQVFIDNTTANCVVDYNTYDITCDPLNVGTNIGSINIFGRYDEENQDFFVDDVIVNRSASSDQLQMDCTPKLRLIDTFIDCTGSTPNNTVVENLKIFMRSDSFVTSDCFQDGNTFEITCDELNVGLTIGLIDVIAFEQVNNPLDVLSNEPDNGGIAFENINNTIIDKIRVIRPATIDDIININCTPNPAKTNSTVDCDVEIDEIYIDIENVQIKNEISGDIIDCDIIKNFSTELVETITCPDLPVGDIPGVIPVSIQFTNQEEFIQKGEFIALEDPNNNNVVITCQDSVKSGENITCSGTVNDYVDIEKVFIRIDELDVVVECQINQNIITCPDILVPNDYKGDFVTVSVGYNPDPVFNKLKEIEVIQPSPFKEIQKVVRTGSIQITVSTIAIISILGLMVYYIKAKKSGMRIR